MGGTNNVVLQCELGSTKVQIDPLAKIKSNTFLKLSNKLKHVTDKFVGMIGIATAIVVVHMSSLMLVVLMHFLVHNFKFRFRSRFVKGTPNIGSLHVA